MIIRVGGPYADIRVNQRLIFQQMSSAAANADHHSSYLAIVRDVAIQASGGAFADEDDLRIKTDGGVRFVPGTGTIPRAPPPPYDPSVKLDLSSNCGWLFVSNGSAPIAVIRVEHIAWEQNPSRARQWVMLYSPLPDQ